MPADQSKPTPISVIVAAKNAGDTISLCLKSALVGLRKDDELLVFLDGCTDDTPEKVRAIADSRVRVFESKTGVGRSEARNYLINRSAANLVAVLDADDIALPWRFAISRRLLRKFDFVFGSAFLFGDMPLGLGIAISYPVRLSPSMANQTLAYRNPFIHSTAAFRKSSLIGANPYEDVLAEEYLLWLRMANRGRTFFRSRIPLSCYRLHQSQISAQERYTERVETCEEIKNAREQLRSRLPNAPQRRTLGLWIEEELLKSISRLLKRR